MYLFNLLQHIHFNELPNFGIRVTMKCCIIFHLFIPLLNNIILVKYRRIHYTIILINLNQ